MYWLFRTKHPPRVKYYFGVNMKLTIPKKLFIFLELFEWVSKFFFDILCFKDQTPSQSEIFSVIVACSYVLAFQVTKQQERPHIKIARHTD